MLARIYAYEKHLSIEGLRVVFMFPSNTACFEILLTLILFSFNEERQNCKKKKEFSKISSPPATTTSSDMMVRDESNFSLHLQKAAQLKMHASVKFIALIKEKFDISIHPSMKTISLAHPH